MITITRKELQQLIQESVQQALSEKKLNEFSFKPKKTLSDDDAVAKVHAIIQFINNNPKSGRTLKQGVSVLDQAVQYDNRNFANKAATFLVFNTDIVEKAIQGTEQDVLALRDWFLGL